MAPVFVYHVRGVEGQLLVRVDAHHQARDGRLQLQIFLIISQRQTLEQELISFKL